MVFGCPGGILGGYLEALEVCLGVFGGPRGILGGFLGDPWALVGFEGVSWGAREFANPARGWLSAGPGPTNLPVYKEASYFRPWDLGILSTGSTRRFPGLVGS